MIGKFLTRNPSKSVPIWIILFLSVFLSAMIATLVESFGLDAQASFEWSKPFVMISSNTGRIEPAWVRRIQAIRDVKFDTPLGITDIATPSLSGSSNRVVLALEPKAVSRVTSFAGWHIASGTLPRSPNQVVMSQLIAQGLGLKVGNWVGNRMGKGPMPGKEQIAGILKAPGAVGLMPLSTWEKLGDIKSANSLLIGTRHPTVVTHDIRQMGLGNAISISSYHILWARQKKLTRSLILIGEMVDWMLAIVLGLTLTFLMALYMFQRRSEFATWIILGSTRGSLLARLLAEIGILAVSAWIVSSLIADLMVSVMAKTLIRHGILISTSIRPLFLWGLPITIIPLLITVIYGSFVIRRLNCIAIFQGGIS